MMGKWYTPGKWLCQVRKVSVVRIRLEIEDDLEKPRRWLYAKTPPEGVMRLPPTMWGKLRYHLPMKHHRTNRTNHPNSMNHQNWNQGSFKKNETLDLKEFLEKNMTKSSQTSQKSNIDLLMDQRGGSPVTLQQNAQKCIFQKVLDQMIKARRRNARKKVKISTAGEFIVRNVSLNHLRKVKQDQHWEVVEAIKHELASVPVDPMHGYIQGQVLQLLQENREDLEGELETMESVKVKEERRVCQMRVCAAQVDGSGGEEQLQTVTVPLHKVRMEKEKWYDPMLAEYNSLVKETKAIRPVKRSEIDPEAELVPGKLVCVIKAEGRYKCRAVICGKPCITRSRSNAIFLAVRKWGGRSMMEF